jgi:uncharacterized protein (TIGR02996 family)
MARAKPRQARSPDEALRASFLQTICETPGDDAARLIYADWLQDHGEPERAAFIRAQIENATLEQGTLQLADREEQADVLLAANRAAWVAGLPAWARKEAAFARGFVRVVRGTALQFIKDGAAIRRQEPLEEVVFTKGPERLETLGALPALEGLTGLELNFPCSGWDIVALATSPYLSRLQRLDLTNSTISEGGTRGVTALFRAPQLAGLTGLKLGNNDLTPRDLTVIAEAPRLGQLIDLDLGNNNLSDPSVQKLAGSPYLTRLERLDLDGNTLGRYAVRALTRARKWAGPTHLNLSSNWLGNDGVKALTASKWDRLVDLALTNTEIGPVGARALAAWRGFARLRHLQLRENPLEEPGIHALAAADASELRVLGLEDTQATNAAVTALVRGPVVRNLTNLSLNQNHLDDATARAITGSPHLTRLSRLGLAVNQITSSGAQALAESANLAQLRWLGLWDNDIGAEGAVALASSPHLAQLRVLHLGRNRIGDAGAMALLQSPYLQKITDLVVWQNIISRPVQAMLTKRFGDRVET